jgi:hypothetical protein
MTANPSRSQHRNVMNAALSKAIGWIESLQGYDRRRKTRLQLKHYPLLADRAAYTAANDLLMQFGVQAQSEAALRADRSRLAGNLIHFCHWRSIERAIDVLSNERPTGAIH